MKAAARGRAAAGRRGPERAAAAPAATLDMLRLHVLLLLLPQLQAGASRRPLQVHAGYNCNLPDRKNATSWLDFGWDHLDVLNFGGRTVAVQRDGAATWWGDAECNPPKNAGEAALIAHAHAQGVQVLLKIGWNNSLGGDALHEFLNDNAAMEVSACGMCARAKEARCDGLSVDFEAPNTRFNATFRGLYAAYVKRLSAVASQQKLAVTATLFMDLPSNTGIDAKAVADAASAGVVLMTYDYHWGCGDKVAGPNAPLIGNNNDNVNHTVSWALLHGMPAESLLLGIAWYGREYPTTGPQYQAPTNCSTTLPDQGARAYQAPLALKRAKSLGVGGELWDDLTMTPWYQFKDKSRPWLWWQGYFDDARSLGLSEITSNDVVYTNHPALSVIISEQIACGLQNTSW